MLWNYLNLTKPRISLLFAVTGLAALVIEGSLISDPLRLCLIVLAIFMTGGSANAFNQYFERNVDSLMARTAKKRSLPLGLVTPRNALIFSILLGVSGIIILFYFGGALAALLGVATIIYYSFYYTLWLKPRTPYNIVIGGLAGATGPLIAWAAVTGELSIASLIMCAIIFFWTPPHFWALALCCKEDYRKVGYPMLPLVIGDEATRKQILAYSFSLLPITMILPLFSVLGTFYFVSALVLNLIFIWFAWQLYVKPSDKQGWKLFAYSIIYVLLLFIAMMIDALWL